MMKAAIIFDSLTGHTAQAAEYIAEGIRESSAIDVGVFRTDEADADFVKEAAMVILGSPTYMASLTGRMKLWLEHEGRKFDLAGKIGGVFATEQYIHGGADLAMQVLLTHELVFGMLVYSGGTSCGKPVIHLGPVGMSQDIEAYRELFHTYGRRMGKKLEEIIIQHEK